MHSLIVLTFDGLATSALGPYGCSWLDTPGLNRLAASSLVFDRIVAASTSPAEVLSGFFRDPRGGRSVAAVAASLGLTPLLFTDSADAVQLAADDAFEQCVRIEGLPGETSGDAPLTAADHVEEMHYARLLAAALAHRETQSGPVLLWIHSACLARLWDAPDALRTADQYDEYEAEDDEEGYSQVDFDPTADAERAELEAARRALLPPQLKLGDDADPDLLLAWMSAYGGQIRAIDSLIDVLHDALEEGPTTDLVIGSTSGFALGENGWIGPAAGPPCSARIQLPLMIRQSGRQPLRSLHPASSDRVAATLVEMLHGAAPAEASESLLRDVEPARWASAPDPLNPMLETRTADSGWTATDDADSELVAEEVLRTSPGWFYHRDASGDEHLYLKPDDRNDANDIAELKPEVVDALRNAVGHNPARG